MAGRTVFVGIPDGPGGRRISVISVLPAPNNITEDTIRATFEQYGHIEEVKRVGHHYVVTYASAEQALHAKERCAFVLTFPESERSCDVMEPESEPQPALTDDQAVVETAPRGRRWLQRLEAMERARARREQAMERARARRERVAARAARRTARFEN